ncbi:MAG: hypothetical protein ACK4HW_11390 [Roseinatronobacter sp.]
MTRIWTLCAALLATPVSVQDFTTQAEVQPILTLTRANWVGIGTATGNDLLYFTQILAWRCGITGIRYGLNGAEPVTDYTMEPCHSDLNPPNQIRDLPCLVFPLNSIEQVTVEITYPDGQVDRESYQRSAIRLD